MKTPSSKFNKSQMIKDLESVLTSKFSNQRYGLRSAGNFRSSSRLSELIGQSCQKDVKVSDIFDYFLSDANQQKVRDQDHLNRESRSGTSAGPFLTTSDFSDLLSSAVNKVVVASFEDLRGRQSYIDWINFHSVDNFKDIERPQLGSTGGMLEHLPGVDSITNQSYGFDSEIDRSETYNLKTYRRTISMTRQAFFNDDQMIFESLFSNPMSAIEKEADLVYSQLVSGEVGGASIYSADRKNNHTASSLREAVDMMTSAMRVQTSFNNTAPLGLSLGFLVVPASMENEAHEIRYQLFGENFDHGFKVCVEPRIDTYNVSTNYVYGVSGETHIVPFIDLATLGNTMPQSRTQESFNNDVMSWSLTHFMAAKALNFESAQRCVITGS